MSNDFKSDGSGALDTTDFVLTASGGTAKLVKGYPDSVKAIGNTYTLSFSLNGIADGAEELVFKPKENGIYDSTGNAASTTQNFSKLNLNELIGEENKPIEYYMENLAKVEKTKEDEKEKEEKLKKRVINPWLKKKITL